MTISEGMWVKRKDDGRRGIVKEKSGHYAQVLWIGESQARSCGIRSLRPCTSPRALVLEGSLDRKLESTRSEQNLLRAWLDSNNIKLAYKNIHTLEDFRIIGREIGENKPPFVHISCHGNHEDKLAYIMIARTSDRIYLNKDETIEVFREVFRDMPILFSACLLGRYKEEMDKFRINANLGDIVAFTREVYDPEFMLFELFVYHGVYDNGWSFRTAAKKAEKALNVVNIKGIKKKGLAEIF